MRMSAVIVLLLVLGPGLGGCSSDSPTTLSAPSDVPPTVFLITPNKGSTLGGTPVTITGTGFQSGATVTFDGTASLWKPWIQSSTSIQVTTPAHAAGTVAVSVTNPDGQAVRSTGEYTYAPPETLDFNGTWEGGAGPEMWEFPIRFTIQNNSLVRVSCGTSGTVTFSPPPPISNGEFFFGK